MTPVEIVAEKVIEDLAPTTLPSHATGYRTLRLSPGGWVSIEATQFTNLAVSGVYVAPWKSGPYSSRKLRALFEGIGSLATGAVLDANAAAILLIGTGTTLFEPVQVVEGSLQVRSIADMVAEIRTYLSLKISELAEILHVGRPTIYAWLSGETGPHQRNLVRLHSITQVADTWKHLASESMGEFVRQPDNSGVSVLDLLREDTLDQPKLSRRFLVIAERLRRRETVAGPRMAPRLSPAKLAEKYGVDLSEVSDSVDYVDWLSGKERTPRSES